MFDFKITKVNQNSQIEITKNKNSVGVITVLFQVNI